MSFKTGVFPTILKEARVTPIHKKNEKDKISNYRGISILSVFSKVIEKAMCARLVEYLEKFKLLAPQQFGFRTSKCTTDAIYSIYKFVIESLEEKQKVACVFYDFTRAFETVNHSILLEKLEGYGVRGLANSWIASYLKNRSQKVRMKMRNGTYESGSAFLDTGVPQGSILGPVLFLVFINDLADVFNTMGVSAFFADDASIAVKAHTLTELRNKLIECNNLMLGYCADNGVIMNPSKTEFMQFSTKSLKSNLYIPLSGNSIAQNDFVKFLGIRIDSQLNWHHHVDYLVNILAKNCYVLRRLRGILELNILKTYYFSKIHSLIMYGIRVWGCSSFLERVLILQKRIVRTMLGKASRTHCKPLFRELEILTAPCVYIFECATYVTRNRNLFINFQDRNIRYNLRNKSNLLLPTCRLTMKEESSMVESLKIFNELPKSLKCLQCPKLFKIKLKEFLTEKAYYSVEEFLNT